MEQPKGRSRKKAAFLTIVTVILLFIGAGLIIRSQGLGFISKAKRSELKTMFAAAYTGQRSHIEAWGYATPDLKKVGYSPSEGGRYRIGFASAESLSLNRDVIDVKSLRLSSSFGELANLYCPECVVSGTSFKMIAIGNIDDDETPDVWTMDQDKNLIHFVDDTKE